MRRLLAMIGALALAGALSYPANAGPSNDPLTFAPQFGLNGHHTAHPVDFLTWCSDCVLTDYKTGTPWVENPHDNWPYGLPTFDEFEPGCMWDTDDSYSWLSHGNVLAAGASVTVTECRYAYHDLYPELRTDVGIVSASPDLVVTERWDWDGGTITHRVPAAFDRSSRQWRYTACVTSPLPDAPEVVIPNSNGGVGIPQLITITVTNPTGRKVGQTGGYIEAGIIQGIFAGCTTYSPA